MRKLGEPMTAEEIEAVIAEARACLGIRWRHMGRAGLPYGHNVGLDCIGLVIRAVRKARPVGDIRVYARQSDGERLKAEMDIWLGPRVSAYRPGSVAMMLLGGSPHVGLVAARDGRLTLIHSYNGRSPAGRVMEHGFDAAWQGRVVAGWAL
jgi:cell wall-associated NlpC family hydrolase